MVFSSSVFLFFFLPLVLFMNFVALRKSLPAKNVFLFAVSIVFYAWGEPVFVLLMLVSILVNWFFGILITERRSRRQVKFVLVLAIAVNIGALFAFKYLGFAARNLGLLLNADIAVARIALPIGISFYTFQALSYVIDVYRGIRNAQKNILNVGLYIAFFPQLIAGPIVRYETIALEINDRRETLEDFCDGTILFILGLAKKIILANNLGSLADAVFAGAVPSSTATAWIGIIAYTFQIFFDFSGYSDMAIGLGRMFGFHFERNFNYPYVSRSVSEFWQRWHISLGTWFKDYVYFPLGGSRVGKGRLVFNLFVVWSLTGIWHGANWTFLLWGLLYFALITVEKLTGFGKNAHPLGHAYTLFFVIMGWVLFRSASVTAALAYLGSMFGASAAPLTDSTTLEYVKTYWVFFVAAAFASTPFYGAINALFRERAGWRILKAVTVMGLFVLSAASIVNSRYNPFIYFNF